MISAHKLRKARELLKKELKRVPFRQTLNQQNESWAIREAEDRGVRWIYAVDGVPRPWDRGLPWVKKTH